MLDIFSALFCCKVLITPIVALVQRVVSRLLDGNGAIDKKYQFHSTILLFIVNKDLHGVPDLLHYDLIHILFNYITTIFPVSFLAGKIKERQRQNYNKKQHPKSKQSQGCNFTVQFLSLEKNRISTDFICRGKLENNLFNLLQLMLHKKRKPALKYVYFIQ